MIKIHIICKEESQAIEIADFLIDEKLILDAVLIDKVSIREKNKQGKFVTLRQTLMMGRTKGLLFQEIDRQLRLKFEDNMPVLYSVPIVDMDWEQASVLISKTAKV